MVLAAGFGRRLDEITAHVPKSMIRINSVALIDHAIQNLATTGVKHILVNVHYKSATLEDFIGRQQRKKKYQNSSIHFLPENQILETGGAVLSAMRLFQLDEIIVINSDIMLPKANLSPLLKHWNDKMQVLGMLYNKMRLTYPSEGDFDLDRQKRLIPNRGGQYIWMGAYRIRRKAFLDYLDKPDTYFPIMDVIFKNPDKKYYGCEYKGLWLDIATLLKRNYYPRQDKWGQMSTGPVAPALLTGTKLVVDEEMVY